MFDIRGRGPRLAILVRADIDRGVPFLLLKYSNRKGRGAVDALKCCQRRNVGSRGSEQIRRKEEEENPVQGGRVGGREGGRERGREEGVKAPLFPTDVPLGAHQNLESQLVEGPMPGFRTFRP